MGTIGSHPGGQRKARQQPNRQTGDFFPWDARFQFQFASFYRKSPRSIWHPSHAGASHPAQHREQGFTLIEVIGVLAVIGILASVLIPLVFNAINDARINATAVSINTIKTGCVEHFARFNSLTTDGSTQPPSPILLDGSDARASDYDFVLLNEGLLDKTFMTKIGFGYVEILPGTNSSVGVDGSNSAYDLDGNGSPNDAAGTVVAQVVIVDITLADARALNDRIDGPGLGENPSGNDFRGRVKYAKLGTGAGGNGNGNGNSGNPGNGHGKAWAWGHNRGGANSLAVCIYLTHR